MAGTGMQNTEEEQLLEEAFNVFDRDGDRTISLSEFGMVLRAVGFNPPPKDVEKFIKKLDKNNSGKLEFEEFKAFYKEYKPKHKNDAKAIANAFRAFDKNGNGFIEKEEIRMILKNCGQDIDDEEISEMIDVADINKDGLINYEEFAKFICKPIQ